MSCLSPSATLATTVLSRGLTDSNVLPLAASTNLPSINSFVRDTFCAARFVHSSRLSRSVIFSLRCIFGQLSSHDAISATCQNISVPSDQASNYPTTCLLAIASVHRTGSTLLCSILRATHMAGMPMEYLNIHTKNFTNFRNDRRSVFFL
ncbi:MAG: hypothetical protein EBV51_07195 [Acidimicrobiia bacterium]|nr:hypothetical protein [Acidimicrobiia bacterium]